MSETNGLKLVLCLTLSLSFTCDNGSLIPKTGLLIVIVSLANFLSKDDLDAIDVAQREL